MKEGNFVKMCFEPYTGNWISEIATTHIWIIFRMVPHVIPQLHTPQKLHLDTSLSCGWGAGQYWRPARILRGGKLSLLYSKAYSLVETSYTRKLVEELVYSIPNSSALCPCVFTCSTHACLWILWFTDPRANAKQAETSHIKSYCSMKQLFKVFCIRYSNSLLPWGSIAETLNIHDPQFLQTFMTPQLLQVFPEWWFFRQNIKPMS